MPNLTDNRTLPFLNCPGNPDVIRFAKTVAYGVIIVVSLTGNCFIGAIVFKTKSMHRTINYLIVNMAMSDVLLPIFAFPRILTDLYAGYWLIDGPTGLALCKLCYFLQDVSTAVSIQSLVLIAVDRFGAVVFPFRPPVVSSKLSPYFIFSTWIVAMAIHCPYFFVRKLVKIQGKLSCELMWNDAFGELSSLKNYYIAMFIILAVIPFTLMAVLYSIIICSLRSQKMPGGESVSAKEQEKRVRRDRNVLKMVIAIVLGFALFWAPFNVQAFLTFFVWDKNPAPSCGFRAFGFFALFMAYANCAINPCICFTFSGNYRKGFKSFFFFFSNKCDCGCFGSMRSQSWNLQTCSSKEDGQNVILSSLA